MGHIVYIQNIYSYEVMMKKLIFLLSIMSASTMAFAENKYSGSVIDNWVGFGDQYCKSHNGVFAVHKKNNKDFFVCFVNKQAVFFHGNGVGDGYVYATFQLNNGTSYEAKEWTNYASRVIENTCNSFGGKSSKELRGKNEEFYLCNRGQSDIFNVSVQVSESDRTSAGPMVLMIAMPY